MQTWQPDTPTWNSPLQTDKVALHHPIVHYKMTATLNSGAADWQYDV